MRTNRKCLMIAPTLFRVTFVTIARLHFEKGKKLGESESLIKSIALPSKINKFLLN